MGEEAHGSSRDLPIIIDSPASSPSFGLERSPVKVAANASRYRQIIEDISSESASEPDLTVDSAEPFIVEEAEAGVTTPPTVESEQCEGEPLYETPQDKYSAEDIIRILLNPKIDTRKISKVRPLNIKRSSTYVVDLDALDHPDDVKRDNFGVWTHSGSHDIKFESRIDESGNLKIGRSVLSGGDGWEQFSLRRLHSKHPTNSKFRRILSFITDSKGNPHHLCMLTYYIPSGFQPYTLPHGNSKSCKPFYSTWPSTLELIKKEGCTSGPKEVVARVSEKVGGVMGASAPGQLPRSEKQVSNAKRQLQFSGDNGGSDELFVMMQKAKTEDPFIRNINATPDPAVVACTDWQLDDLVRFCAPPPGVKSSILTVDPTFCLGEFECTPITYRHLLLRSRRYGTSPLFLGPVLVHYRKNFPSFLFFASSLVGLRRPLEGIRVIGTDGETALVDALTHEFRFAVHLYCYNHVRSNVKVELQHRKFPENEVAEILDIIFGRQVGGTYCEGLVDAESESMFYQKLEEFKDKMAKKEEENVHARAGFYDWFCRYKVDAVVSGMLKPVREEAGLGVPPSRFTTNASESINAMLKRKVEYRKNELPAFMNHLKQLVDEQEREVERAVVGRGKYEFLEEYKYLEIKEAVWFKMTREQRKAHMQKVASVNLCFDPGDDKQLSLTSASSAAVELCIRPEEFHDGLKIPLQAVLGIWKKAEELLGDPNAISPAPGYDSKCRMVMSRSGKRPHLVTCSKSGKYSCDNECPNWKSMNICSHSLAVAHVNNSLKEFCDLYRRSKRLPSISRLVLTGLPSGIGKKGNRVNRKRKREPESARVPLSFSSSELTSLPSEALGHSVMPHQPESIAGPSSGYFAIPLPKETGPVHGLSRCSSSSQESGANLGLGSNSNSLFSPPCKPVGAVCRPSHTLSTPQPPPYMGWNYSQADIRYTGPKPPLHASDYSFVSPDSTNFTPSMQWNTNRGDIHVQSPTQWNAPYYAYPAFTSRRTSPEIFRLCFRSGNISVCNGCRNKFDKQAQAPDDLCVQHEEWRTYTSPVSKLPESRFGNAYYHAKPCCIIARWPTFSPGDLTISSEIKSRLLPPHKDLLSTLFGVTV